MEQTPVIFRKWRTSEGGILALFPSLPHNELLCQSYEHVGQHGGADYTGMMARTRPASKKEYADLKRELESAPYNYKLQVCTRRTVQHVRDFKANLQSSLSTKETATCQDCGKSFAVDDLNPIEDIFQRVAPGEIMPAGECPECSALRSLDEKAPSARVAPGLPPNAAYYIAQARELYATDDVEIDDEPAVSAGDDGAFVAAWVWVDAETCDNCGMNTGNIGEVKPGLCNLCAVAEGEEV